MNCVFAKTIYTGKSIVYDKYLVFNGKNISGISKAVKGELLGHFDVVTPAFIDPHSHIGMERSGEPSGEGEANDHLDSILALTDALDSVQMDDKAFMDAVESGVLYSCVVPGSGNIIGGQSAVIRNFAANSTEALIGRAGLKAAFGYNPRSTTSWKGQRPSTRMGAIAILRGRLAEVRQKIEKYRQAKGRKKRTSLFLLKTRCYRSCFPAKSAFGPMFTK